LPSVGSGSAISIEYKTLGKLYGREGQDWRIHDRIRVQTSTGRQIEKFIVGTRDGRRVVYFDITDVLGSTDAEPVQEILDALMRRQKGRPLTITLAKGAFLMLFKVMEDVGAQFTSKDFDAESVSDRMIQTLASHDVNVAEQFPITLSVAEWVNVLSITGLIEVPSLGGQEFITDLRSSIEGALKQVGPG